MLCCRISTGPRYRLRMAFQNGCHPYYGISVGVTNEMGAEIGDFPPSQYEPSVLTLLVGQAGSSCQKVMEGVESRPVVYP